MDGGDNTKNIALVSMAIRGDVDAFEALVREYSKTILYQSRRYIRHPDEAEDAAQEAIIAMYQNIHTLRKPEAFRSWLYRLVKFVCLKHMRDLNVRKGGQEQGNIDDYAETLASDLRAGDPALSAEDRERTEKILAVIAALPEKQREALILHYYDGFSYREIAKALGSTTSTVSTNIMKAKRKIMKDLEPALAMAVSLDADAKLSRVDIVAFHRSAMAGIAAAISVAGAGAAAAGAGTEAGVYAAGSGSSVGSGSGSGSGFSFGAGNQGSSQSHVAAATGAVIAALILTAAFLVNGGLDTPQPDAEAMASVEIPGTEPVAAEIQFIGGECACGHLNPAEEEIVVHTAGAEVEGWTLSHAGGDVIQSGGGEADLALHPENLAEGDYVIRYEVKSPDGGVAAVERSFTILHGDYDASMYD